MSEELKAALARIACLEGEIAKRDARIAEMQERFDSSAHRTSLIGRLEIENDQLRAELAAIKAQEPVAFAHFLNGAVSYESSYVICNEPGDCLDDRHEWRPVYAAPVSEAKAQGVEQVQWHVRYLQAETVSDGWWQDSSEQRAAWCAEANQQQHAKGLPDTWEIRRFTIAAPVQQVSVPDISRLLEALERVATLHIVPPYTTPQSSQLMMLKGIADQALESYRAAAPAAPSHGEQVRDALAELLECPASVVQATVPHAGIEAAPPYQVVLDVSVSLTRWKKARAALEAIAPAAPAADAGHVFYGMDGNHP